jgi:RNA polymerase sigma factor for flagellar operon FliA
VTSNVEDDAETQARVREAMDLVPMLARQLRRSLGVRLEVDELASYGHEGLIRAAKSFRPELGVPFRRWANLRVRGAMLDGVRAQADLPRDVYRRLVAIVAGDAAHEDLLERDAATPTTSAEDADRKLDAYVAGMATAMALGLVAEGATDDQSVADRRPLADEALAREELVHAIRAGVEERPEEEKSLLRLVYYEGKSLADAGKELGLSRSWACRIHGRAIDGLAKFLRRNRME